MQDVNSFLRTYDKFLSLGRKINGEKQLIRQSPFNKIRHHEIYTIRNKFIGSGRWLRKKIMMMDSQKHDFVKSTIKHNEKIRRSADKYDRDISSEAAKLIKENEKILL